MEDLNVRPCTIKFLIENIDKIHFDINRSCVFFNLSPKKQEIKAKINKWDSQAFVQKSKPPTEWKLCCMLSHFSHVQLCNSMDCSPPGSSVHRVPQASILEWVDVSSSRGSTWPRDWTLTSCTPALAGALFTTEPPRKPLLTSRKCTSKPQGHVTPPLSEWLSSKVHK